MEWIVFEDNNEDCPMVPRFPYNSLSVFILSILVNSIFSCIFYRDEKDELDVF